jgi:hypothetical protein
LALRKLALIAKTRVDESRYASEASSWLTRKKERKRKRERKKEEEEGVGVVHVSATRTTHTHNTHKPYNIQRTTTHIV